MLLIAFCVSSFYVCKASEYFKFTVVCAAVIATAGCDQGQPANPTPTTTPEQGTSTVPLGRLPKSSGNGDEAQLRG